MLEVDGEPLTCERIKRVIEDVFADHGVEGSDMIVAHGPQTAVGHNMGSGQIAPNEPIVFDLFPRDKATGCYSDMTRTYVVGEPSDEVKEWHGLVRRALETSTAGVKPGVNGRTLFEGVCEQFQEAGYKTQLNKEPGEVLEDGFFHSLGHGVGLEVHELPSLGRADQARPRRRDHDRAGALSLRHRRPAPGGHRPRHRGRPRGAHPVPVRPGAVTNTIETMLLEERRYEPPAEFARQANAQPEIYERDWESFWEAEGRERVTWFEPFSKLYEWEPPYAKWYLGGKLNVCFNCVDRHVAAGTATRSPITGKASPRTSGARSRSPTCSARSSSSRTA